MTVKCFLVERISESPELWQRADGVEQNGSKVWPWPGLFGPGAIYRDYEGEQRADEGAWWRKRGPDGYCWNVWLPCKPGYDGSWNIDGRSTNANEGFWTRTGEAPNFTVTPSLNAGWWHGYLTNGELIS